MEEKFKKVKSNFKTFSHKLIALFVAIIMAASCFTGVMTAFAAEQDARQFQDENLAANFMTWAETTDEQTAEALLDWVDLYLGDLLKGLLGGTNEIHFSQSIVVATIKLDLYLDSVDGLIDALRQVQGLLNSYGGLIGGDVNNINLSALPNLESVTSGDQVISGCGRSYRANNSAKTILMALAQTLVNNANDQSGNKNVIGQFIKGQLNLGSILNGVLGSDVYTLLKDKVFNSSLHMNLWDGYQSNLVYNIVAELIFYLTDWYTEDQIAQFENYLKGNGGTKWNFDEQLFSKLSTELLANINATITYPGDITGHADNSRTRYAEIQDYIADNGGDVASASIALGYDPNLKYTDDGNVYLFQYEGLDTLSINKDSKLVQVATDALKLAWNTALKPTVGIVHVNYDSHDDGHGTNFDNQFYYWAVKNIGWDEENIDANYSETNVKAWAAAMAPEYKAKDADEFLSYVKNTFDWDRQVVADPQGTWKDIDSTKLWGKLRYSPLADKYFDMQTGPLNLFFMETGAPNLTAFLDNAINDAKYSSTIVSMANDVLVAAVKDFFPDSKNIGLGDGNNKVTTNLARPSLTETADTTKIGSTVVLNAVKMFEYAANATDENILNAYYTNHKIVNKTASNNLSEETFEESMIPFLIACLQNIEFAEMIHDEKWDSCKDAEGVAYVALEEYLSYVLPNKDYSVLISKDTAGKLNVDLTAIEVMARDAVGYLLSSIVPCRDKNGNEWDVYSAPVNNNVTIYEILNSVVCYYAGMDNFTDGDRKTTGKGVASLLGVVDSNGNCLVKNSNTLWQNLDAVVNKLLPILGTFLNGREASVSTEDLLYNKIIKGVLDIGPNKGVTTILEQIITIFTAEPTTKGIDGVVYDFLAQEINALLGSRGVSGMTMNKVVPRLADLGSGAATPFDTLVSSNVLAKYVGANGKEDGIIGCLLQSLFEILGGNNKSAAQAKGAWTGAMFAVKAVNNFIPSFVPQLSEHKFAAATVSIPNSSQSGVVAGQKMAATNLEFKNNCIGLNRFWRDSNKNLNQDSRYFVNITDISYADPKGNVPSNFNLSTYTKGAIAPESSIKIGLTGNYAAGTQLIKFTVKYNVFEGKAAKDGTLPAVPTDPSKILYKGLTTSCYLYLTDQQSWESSFYDATNDSGVRYNNSDQLSANTKRSNKGGNMYVNVFNKFIISSTNPESVDTMGLAITAENGSGGIDALYSYIANDAADVYVTDGDYAYESEAVSAADAIAHYADSYGTDSVGSDALAYANFDRNTGAILNKNKVDILFPDESDDWMTDLTPAEADAEIDARSEHDGEGNITKYPNVEQRDHIAYTFEEGVDNAIIRAVERTQVGEDSYVYYNVYVDPAVIENEEVTPATQISGLDMVSIKTSLNNATAWYKWLKHTGDFDPQSFDMNIAAKNSAGTMIGTTRIIISNDKEAVSLQNQYDTALKEMAPYGAVDFYDYDDSDPAFPYSDTYDDLQTAFQNVVEAISQPVTMDKAEGLASTYETTPATTVTSSATGDIAYKPIDGQLVNGFPTYAHELLTDADVVGGKDSVGNAVVKGEDGNYYLANTPAFEYDWITTGIYKGAPYWGKTTKAATDEEGNALYDQVQYRYVDANGYQVGSNDAWVYKTCITNYAIKAGTADNDYRGFYQKNMDNLNYSVAEARKNINGEIAALIGVGIKEDREGLDSVNYNVASYEKMVQIAKSGEKLISTTYDEEGVPTYSTSASSTEVNEAVRIYNIYKDRVMTRAYEGRAINEEIKCASGVEYNKLTGKEATETTPASVKTTASAVRFGVVKNGTIVNEGAEVYTAKSWNAYIEALAHAAVIANEKTALLSDTYGAKKELQIAENNLTVDSSMTVSFTVKAASNATGTTSIDVPVAGASIIVDGEEIGTTDENGAVTLNVQIGTTEITISGDGIIDRTVNLTGEASITGAETCVVAYDYDNNGKINTVDAKIMSDRSLAKGEANAFKAIFGKKVVYAAASLD